MNRRILVLMVGAAAVVALVAVNRRSGALAQPPVDKNQPSKIETASFALG